MLIFSPAKWDIDRWMKQCVCLSTIALGAICTGLLLFYCFYPWNGKELLPAGSLGMQKGGRMLFPYESIGSGALALHPRHAFGWVTRLADELAVVAYNSRPDIDLKESKILLALKAGKEQLTLSNGRTLYLKESEQGKGLSSSEAATGLWVKPILLDNGTVLIEAGRKIASGEEHGQFILAQQGGSRSQSGLSFAKELKTARCYPNDLLIQKYGGREFSSWRDKVVLEFSKDSGTYALFASPGDDLIYESGEWSIANSREEMKKDLPVAKVRAVTGKAIEIEAWDDTGFYPVHVNVEMEKQGRIQLKPETMPTAIRMRSGTQVSCAFGKRRMILKQGDWLLKTTTGWRNLRKWEDIDQYLHHRINGELFIFDGIEKEGGRTVLKGHLFDESRTYMQPIALPVDAEKTKTKTSRKRKPLWRAAA